MPSRTDVAGLAQLASLKGVVEELIASGDIARFSLPETFSADLRLSDLPIDSLGRTTLGLAIEQRLGFRLAPEAMHGDSTLGELLASAVATESGVKQALVNGYGRVDSRNASIPDFYRAVSPDLFQKARDFQGFVGDFKARQFDRYQLPVLERRGGRALVDAGSGAGEREVILYASADYLDLSVDSDVAAASAAAAARYGTSVASVTAIAGNTDLHDRFRGELARFVGYDDLTLFPTGYAANMGTIAALCNSLDYVLVDKQVHYSILEGVRLAGSQWGSFTHSDLAHLEQLLKAARAERPTSGILVIAEGVYGIDGDLAPVAEIGALARRYEARVLLDDAHATGVIGATGGGTAEGLPAHRPDLLMGSLSKSLGSLGGWIAAEGSVAEYLRYFAKSVVFSVGLPAPVIAAAAEALRLIRTEPARIAHLQRNAMTLRDGLVAIGCDNAGRSASAIMSIKVGSEPVLRDVLRDLFFEGVWAEGLPFPAVPRGEERLRFRARASHTDDDIRETVQAVERTLSKHGVLKSRHAKPAHAPKSNVPVDGIVDLAVRSTQAAGGALPWINRGYFRKVVAGEPPWASFWRDSQWFYVERGGSIIACLQAATATGREGRPSLGAIGHLYCTNAGRSELAGLVDKGVRYLSTRANEIIGPANLPLQVLGGGHYSGAINDPKPFLEQSFGVDFVEALKAAGLSGGHENRYTLHHMPPIEALSKDSAKLPAGLQIRPLNRQNLVQDLVALTPVFNQTIGSLPYCQTVTPEALVGVAAEIRDVMLADLWWLAILEGKVVGFVGAFPDLSAGFDAARGDAGVADLESLRVSSDRSERGFLAWLGVLPELADQGMGDSLVSEALAGLRRRNVSEVWVSWELVDGPGYSNRLRSQLGPGVQARSHNIWQTTNNS